MGHRLGQYGDDFAIMTTGQVLELFGVEVGENLPQLTLHPRLAHQTRLVLKQSTSPFSFQMAPNCLD